jgi:hypothetical protein
MAVSRAQQKGGMLFAVITFAALFIIATTAAVVFYLRSETFRKETATLRDDMSELATDAERRNIPKIVGAKKPRQTRLGAMVEHLDEAVSLIIGPVAEDAPADVKLETAKTAVETTLAQVSEDLAETDAANGNPGLVRVVQILKLNLDNATDAAIAIDQQLQHVQKLFDQAKLAEREKEKQLHEQMRVFAHEAQQVEQSFDQLQQQMQDDTDHQIQMLTEKLENAEQQVKAKQQQVLRSEAELKQSEQRREYYQDQLDAIKPRPDSDIQAFKADGKILSVDSRNKIVFINIGNEDHVYRGLTFSVYDKNMPVPRDGKPKAEIEVFDVQRSISVARVVSQESKQPLVPDDIVANLIWDTEATNVFVVVGEFDFDGDSLADYDGTAKVIGLVEKWGGTVAEEISVETDFVVLGKAPTILARPTHEQLEMDPMAVEKYQASLQKHEDYQIIEQQSKALSIPIFNLDRFLYFIGYKTLATADSAF